MNKTKPIRLLGLSLTGRCNYACRYCYAHEHPGGKMTIETALKAVELAAGSGEPFVLQFTGGEPLLAFETLQAVTEAVHNRKLPAHLQVQSNGALMTRKIASFLKLNRIGVGISLDGRPEVNDRVRCLTDGSGTASQTLAGIRQLASEGVEIGITCTVTAENVEGLSGVVEMAYYLGNVRRLGFDLLRGQGRGSGMSPLKVEAVALGIKSALETADKLERLTGNTLIITQLENAQKFDREPAVELSGCHAMRGESAFVDAQGRIYACSSLIGEEAFRIGHVDTGIEHGMQHRIMEGIEARMAACRTCADFTRCGGGCYARWIGTGETQGNHETECALKRECIQWRYL